MSLVTEETGTEIDATGEAASEETAALSLNPPVRF